MSLAQTWRSFLKNIMTFELKKKNEIIHNLKTSTKENYIKRFLKFFNDLKENNTYVV